MHNRFSIRDKVSEDIIRKPSVKVIVILAIIIAFFTPENIFSRFPVLCHLSDFYASFIPSFNRFYLESRFPDTTRMLLIYSWSIFPYLLFLHFKIVRHNSLFYVGSFLKSEKENKTLKLIAFIVVGLIFCYLFYAHGLLGDGGRTYSLIISSKFAFFMYVFCFIFGMSFFLPLVFYVSVDLIKNEFKTTE